MSDVKRWTEDRLDELDDLRELLRECETIDRGNCVLSRLKRIIELAKKLDKTDYEKRHTSFLSFLRGEAEREWIQERAAPASPGANP